MSAEEKLITIAEFDNYIQAEMAKQTLADFDIKAVVAGDNASNIYAGVPAVEGPVLQVMDHDAEKAKEILAEQKQPAAGDSETQPEEQ
jgi:hypothetical protein